MQTTFRPELTPRELTAGRIATAIVMMAIAAFVLIAAEAIVAGIPARQYGLRPAGEQRREPPGALRAARRGNPL